MTSPDIDTGARTWRQRLSLCMIVRDEEHFLQRCLESVRDWVDEMIIVDTGSSDRTRDIARQFTDRVYDFEWIDDFAAARNYALGKATGDWILVLDADELIASEDLARLRELIEDAPKSAYFLTQLNYSNNPFHSDWQPVAEKTPYSEEYAGYRPNPICRLFRNDGNIRYHGAIHEVVDKSLNTDDYAVLDLPIHHHMDSDPSKPVAERQLNYLRLLEKTLAEEPSGRNYALAGAVCLFHAQNYEKAIEYFQCAVELDHDVDVNLEGIAEAKYRLGDLTGAHAGYEALYRNGYRTFALYNNLANLKVKRGELNEAIQLLRAALEMGNVDSNIRQVLSQNIAYLEKQIDVS
jgi:glycosyltransferase involved in cell wall biosynthesis